MRAPALAIASGAGIIVGATGIGSGSLPARPPLTPAAAGAAGGPGRIKAAPGPARAGRRAP